MDEVPAEQAANVQNAGRVGSKGAGTRAGKLSSAHAHTTWCHGSCYSLGVLPKLPMAATIHDLY